MDERGTCHLIIKPSGPDTLQRGDGQSAGSPENILPASSLDSRLFLFPSFFFSLVLKGNNAMAHIS